LLEGGFRTHNIVAIEIEQHRLLLGDDGGARLREHELRGVALDPGPGDRPLIRPRVEVHDVEAELLVNRDRPPDVLDVDERDAVANLERHGTLSLAIGLSHRRILGSTGVDREYPLKPYARP